MHKFWKTIDQVYCESVDLGGGGGGSGIGGGEGDPIGAAITSSIAGMEGSDTPAPKAPDPKDVEEENEIKALEDEWRAKNPNAKGNIAIHRHQAVLTRTRNQHQKAAEEWAAKEKAWAEREAAIKAAEEEWKQYEWAKDPDIQKALQAIALAETDEEAFIDLLLTDERYAKRLARQQQQQKQIPSDRPGPNAKTEDGSIEYYDNDGINSLLDWHGATLEKVLTEKIEKAMEQKYGKVAKAYEASATWNEALAAGNAKLDRYRKDLEGFSEHEKAIRAYMEQPGNEKVTVEEAYMRVVPKALREAGKVEKDKLRAEILAEMKTKPAAAAEKQGVVERSGEMGDRDISDVIKAAIANHPDRER